MIVAYQVKQIHRLGPGKTFHISAGDTSLPIQQGLWRLLVKIELNRSINGYRVFSRPQDIARDGLGFLLSVSQFIGKELSLLNV